MRVALVVALAATASMYGTSGAAPAPLITDQAGDANGLNGQGIVDDGPAQGSPGPGSQDSKDIISVSFATLKVKGACTGFTATAEFKGNVVADNSMYRVGSTTATNPSFLLLQHQKDTVERTSVRVAGGTAKTVTTEKPAVIAGTKITWTITIKDLKEVAESSKTVLENLEATSQASLGGALYLPVFDLAYSDKSFKVCG